jgi:hypothetical protein
MGIRRGLLSISRWLGSFPSIGYALIYLLCIPGFAGIFHEMPDSFYHSTVQYEEELNREQDRIKDELKEIINDQWHTDELPPNARIEPKFISNGLGFGISSISNLKIRKIEAGHHLSFILIVPFWGGKTSPEKDYNIFRYEHIPTSILIENDPLGRNLYYPDNISQSAHIELEMPSEMFGMNLEGNRKEILKALFPNTPEIYLRPRFVDKVKAFAAGSTGYASNVTGNFWRMFYLSAVTITTVGYGDIVPLTTSARLLVSIEAILGIVLIGLFLNALSYERVVGQEMHDIKESEKNALSLSQEQQEDLARRVSEYMKKDSKTAAEPE